MNDRDLARAVAERERGRRRLKITTTTVSLASVGVAGAVLAVLPGTTHAAAQSSETSSHKSAPSDQRDQLGDIQFVGYVQELVHVAVPHRDTHADR